MSPSIKEMRHLISSIYPNGLEWKKHVARMPDSQVMAIYFSFLERGEFAKKKKQEQTQTTGVQLKLKGF